MGKIEDKIMAILKSDLTEEVSWDTVGGPTPSETQKGPLDYTKSVKKATVPQATKIPGVGEMGDDDADKNGNITDVLDEEEDEMKGDDEDEKEEKDDEKKDLEETFASLMARLAEEDEKDDDDDDDEDEDEDLDEEEGETSLKSDNGGKPKETLPDVDSKLDSPDKLVNKAPGMKVAEQEGETSLVDDNGGEPEETLPGSSVDSMTDEPEKLVTPAPGAKKPDTVVEEEDEDEDDEDEKKDEDVSEDIAAIFKGVKLSEAAREKAATIFKAAVVRRVNEEKGRVQKIATRKLKEAFAVLKARADKKQVVFEQKLTGQVDRYLNYVVENWMSENRLAVERGVRAELAESFIDGLKTLFVEHYIEIPETKVDVVETLGKKVTSLETKLNEAVESNVKMRASLNQYRKEEVVRAVSTGLADTEREKLNKLAEGVEYTTRKDFAQKLNELKEAYFTKAPKSKPVLTEAAPVVETKKPANNEMSAYMKTIEKMGRKQ